MSTPEIPSFQPAQAAYKLVPVEPTPEMVSDGGFAETSMSDSYKGDCLMYIGDDAAKACWTAMLAAAPAIPAPEGAEWAGAGAFIQHAQNAAGSAGADGHWPDEFLTWYKPADWMGEHRAAAVFLGSKIAALAAPAPQAPVAWVDERAIAWLAGRRDTACITTQLQAGRSTERPMPLYAAPQTKEQP